MGCYDTVQFRCPGCGEEIHEQTKMGECLLRDFTADAVPLDIGAGMDGDQLYCPACHAKWVVKLWPQAPRTVPLILVTP